MPDQKLFVLLIDGDNANSSKLQEILDAVSKVGKVLIRKVYNNKASMEHWEAVIGKYSLDPVWVPNNIKNKNSVDITLVVDAMTLLYRRPDLDGFCIVASDSDYTALAKQMRTENKYVLGIGEEKTPEPFRNACTNFIFIEKLVNLAVPTKLAAAKKPPASDILKTPVKVQQPTKPVVAAKKASDILKAPIKAKKTAVHYLRIRPAQGKVVGSEIDRFHAAYKHVVDALKPQDGWVSLSAIGDALRKLYPNYQPLVYGGVKHAQLKKVLEKMKVDYPHIIELHTKNAL